MLDVAFAILAGGKNSRIGLNKAFLEIDGKTIIQKLLEISNKFPQRMIITNNRDEYNQFPVQKYLDIYPNRGPISGIHTALYYSNYERIFVISCDMPFVSNQLIEQIIDFSDNYSITLPEINNKTHFVCGVYPKSFFGILDSYLKNFTESIDIKNKYFALFNLEKLFKMRKITKNELLIKDEKVFLNINTIEDYNSILNSDN